MSKSLPGFEIEPYFRTSKLMCAWLCLTTPACLSFNYCESENCQLNSGDLFSEGSILKESPNCGYTGITTDATVHCEEKGVLREAPDETAENLCKVQEKQRRGETFE